jgi:hypothetical protein
MTKETWITAGTAAKILEERFGRPIRVDYVTRLGSLGRLRKQDIGSRIVLYHRHDVEQIHIREKKSTNKSTQATQTELPTLESVPTPSTPEKPIPAIPKPEVSQISVSKRLEGLPTSQPPNTMKRGEFVEMYKLNNGPFGKWLENGLGDDKLEATWYISFPNKKKSACFTPEQIAHNLEVLKRHGKLKE